MKTATWNIRLLLLFTVIPVLCVAQSEIADMSGFIQLNNFNFLDLLEDNPSIEKRYVLENGETYDQKFLDSVKTLPENEKFVQRFFTNKEKTVVYIQLAKNTTENQKRVNDEFQEKLKQAKKSKNKLIGENLSELVLTGINGNTYKIADLKGKIILMNFWFTKCGSCIKEIPDLHKMQEKFAGKDVLFFAVTYNEAARIQNFLKKVPFNFTHITESQAIIDQLGVTFFPTNILIDKQGEVVFFSDFDAFIGGKELQNITKLITKNLKKEL